MFARNQSKRSSRALEFAFSFSLVCMMFSSAALAQPWNKKASVTFSQPVEIPGAGAPVLAADTYVFMSLDSQSDRHIVQVFSQDEAHIYATILVMTNYRLQSTGETVMTFAERSAGSPQAVRAWFYPGDRWGQEFVYPKARAVELAKITNQPVLYMATELAPAIIAPVNTANDALVIALMEAPLKVVKPTGEEVAIAEFVRPAPVQQTVNPPKTASRLRLPALIALLSLSIGLSLRALWYRKC